jgi:hypothetical protein
MPLIACFLLCILVVFLLDFINQRFLVGERCFFVGGLIAVWSLFVLFGVRLLGI